jgi:hypothetical protein
MTTKAKGKGTGKSRGTSTATTTPKKPRRRQPALPGLEAPKHPDVDAAADAFVEVRDERMGLTSREVEARDALIAVMKTHGLSVYRIETDEGALLVTVTDESKVTVRKEKAKRNQGDDEAA